MFRLQFVIFRYRKNFLLRLLPTIQLSYSLQVTNADSISIHTQRHNSNQ
jgi:hypothetical protein